MSEDEIFKILKFLSLKLTIEQFNKIAKYVKVNYIEIDTDDLFKIHITSLDTGKINCNIIITNINIGR